jgi:hypothetical protein
VGKTQEDGLASAAHLRIVDKGPIEHLTCERIHKRFEEVGIKSDEPTAFKQARFASRGGEQARFALCPTSADLSRLAPPHFLLSFCTDLDESAVVPVLVVATVFGVHFYRDELSDLWSGKAVLRVETSTLITMFLKCFSSISAGRLASSCADY